MLVEPLDGAALAGRVAALEKNNVTLTGVLGPVLPFKKLDLQGALGFFVLVARHARVVRVVFAPRFNRGAIGLEQHWVVVVGVVDPVALDLGEVDHRQVVVFVVLCHEAHLSAATPRALGEIDPR